MPRRLRGATRTDRAFNAGMIAVLGGALLWAGGFAAMTAYHRYELDARGITVPARVQGRDSGGAGDNYYLIMFRFRPVERGSSEVSGESQVAFGQYARLRSGATVPVRYLRTDPEVNQIWFPNDDSNRRKEGFMIVLGGLVAVLLGLACLRAALLVLFRPL